METYKVNGLNKIWTTRQSAQRNQAKLFLETGLFWYVAHEYKIGWYLEIDPNELTK